MAYVQEEYCNRCKQKKPFTYAFGTDLAVKVCDCCRTEIEANEKSFFLSALKTKPIEERIARIEEILYKKEMK